MRKLFAAASILFLLLPGKSTSAAELVNGINVVVNDAVITYQDVQVALTPLVDVLASQYRNQPQVFNQKLEQTRTNQVQELVEDKLVLEEFRAQKSFGIPEKQLNDYIDQQVRLRFGDRATLTKTLQAQGRSFESYRKQERDRVIIDVMTRQNVSSDKILVSPHKIDVYYREHEENYKLSDEVRLRLLVLNKGPNRPSDTTKKLADEIQAKVRDGVPFAEMASIYSDSNRAQGGDRGWIGRAYFKKELADVAFTLKTNQVSEVIDLPEASYLMLVEEARSAHVRPLEEVRAEIENILKAEERNRLRKKWMDRLRNKSYVEYYRF